MNTQTSQSSNTSSVSAIVELFLVFVLITFAAEALPDGFINFMIKEFGSIGSFFMAGGFYFAIRIILMIRISKHRGGAK